MERLRVIFMGSAPLSCPSLKALIDCPWCEVVSVVTQPDRPKGRELRLQPTPVKVMAGDARLAVLQPEKSRHPDFISAVRDLRSDLVVVAAFGQILPRELLELPRFGCVNVHTSLLPKYRGAAPIQCAILNDELETGVTIMKMDEGLDTGAILAQRRTKIAPEDDARTLHDRLAVMGAELLLSAVKDYVSGVLQPVPQPAEGVSYARKIHKQDGLIDWNQPARAIWNLVRGLVPWPCAFTHVLAGAKPRLLKIWHADIVEGPGAAGEILRADKRGILVGCGRDALNISSLQQEGGRRLMAQEFLAGHTLRPGTRLG